MRKKLMPFLLVLFVISFILPACGTDGGGQAGDENFMTTLQLGTGSTGGTYYPLGQEIANVMNANVDTEGFDVSAIASGASVENLASILQGNFQLGMTVHVTAIDALNGQGEFDGTPIENFGFISHIYPEVMQVIARADAGINSIADLEGKRVAIGPPGSATQSAAKLILEAYGLEDGDYTPLQEGFGVAADAIGDGTVDASFGLLGLPYGEMESINRSRNIVLLPIEGEALQYIEENSGYGSLEIPDDTYNFLDGPVNTITAYAVLVGSTNQISEELGYEITKALYENIDTMTHDVARRFMTQENFLNGSEQLPLHPGAEMYFREIGLQD
ncbi:TRAP transporter [Alkalihalophilus pseudofirmus]|nr:TRAP transporter [Alkalihalophilus pseudofirmus]